MMDKRMPRRWLVACSVLALAACITPRGEPDGGMQNRGKPRYNDQVCNEHASICEIEVRIVCDPQQPCVGVVDPKVLLVLHANDERKRTIRWKLTGMFQDYEFKDEKVIRDPPFDCTSPGQHQKQVQCDDMFDGAQHSFPYELQVIKSSDGSTLTVDPWIVNR